MEQKQSPLIFIITVVYPKTITLSYYILNQQVMFSKKSILTFIAAILSFSIFAQGIQFSEGSWAEIKAKAKAEKKYIFVDAYAVWCGPCKWMAKEVFTDAKVGETYNKQFVSYKFDMEKGEGLDFAPYPGDLGKRIYENISKEGWQEWVGHQTMLINEYRLTPIEPEARKFLETEMEKYFFSGGAAVPKEFVPKK